METQFRYKTVRAYVAEMITCVVCCLAVVGLVLLKEMWMVVAFAILGGFVTLTWVTTRIPNYVGRFVDRRWPRNNEELQADRAVVFIMHNTPGEHDTATHARTLPTLTIVKTPAPEPAPETKE